MTIDYKVLINFTDEELKVLKDALKIVEQIADKTHSYDCVNIAAEKAYDGLYCILN